MEFKKQEQVDRYFEEKFSEKNKTIQRLDELRNELLDAVKQGYSIKKYEKKFNYLADTLLKVNLN